jgi:hypothetical protein
MKRRIARGDKVEVDFDGKEFVARKAPADAAARSELGGFAALAPLALATLIPQAWLLPLVVGGTAALAAYLALRAAFGEARPQAPPAAWRRILPAGFLAALLFASDWLLKAWVAPLSSAFVVHVAEPMRLAFTYWALPLSLGAVAWILANTEASSSWLEAARRFRSAHPLLGAAPYAFLGAATKLSRMKDGRQIADLAERHPALARARQWAWFGAALILGAMAGNAGEVLLKGGAVDYIPVGPMSMNLADALLFLGMPIFFVAAGFFEAVRRAAQTGAPVFQRTWVLHLPALLAGAAVLLTLPALPAWSVYALFAAVAWGIGATLASRISDSLQDEMNLSFRFNPSRGIVLGPAQRALSWAYRLKRWAYAAAAALPFLGGLNAPSLSARERAALVERYRAAKPRLVVMDWDNTFTDNRTLNQKISPRGVAVLRALKEAGVRVAFDTNRPLGGGDFGMMQVLIEQLPEDLRGGFLLATGGGAEVYRLGPKGEQPAAPERFMAAIPAADREAMVRFLREEGARLGIAPANYHEQGDRSYEHALILDGDPAWTPQVRLQKAADLHKAFLARMRAAGLSYKIDFKIPRNIEHEPYIRVRSPKAVKASGVDGILRILAEEGVSVSPEDVLIFGDEFAKGEDDVSMAEALPRATALSVGTVAHAGTRNLHLLGGGPDATHQFLEDILK